jgi:hypothetical protein
MAWGPDPDNTDLVGVSPTVLHRRYTILALAEDGKTNEIIARGFADLTLYQSSDGNWYITRWEDRPDPVQLDPNLTQVTWGWRRLDSQ